MKLEEAIKIIRETKEGFPKHKPVHLRNDKWCCYYCQSKLVIHQKRCNFCYTEQDWSHHEQILSEKDDH